MQNKPLCILPFMHQSIGPDGGIKLCCEATEALKNKNQSLNVQDISLQEAWHHSSITEVRQQMLDNVWPSYCTRCKDLEKAGQKSMRQAEWESIQQQNDSYAKVKKRIEQYETYDSVYDPFYLDIWLGNLCNLACKTCRPANSSKLVNERRKIYNQNAENYNRLFESNDEFQIYSWIDDNNITDTVYQALDNIGTLRFTGGEPTIVPLAKNILQYVIDHELHTKMALRYHTNAVSISDEWLQLTGYFSDQKVRLSIDGIGEVQDYIRRGSDWEIVDHNVKTLLQNKQHFIIFNPTLQTLNAPYLKSYLDWIYALVDDDHWDIQFNILTNPSVLSIAKAPFAMKQKIKQSFVECLDHPLVHNKTNLENSIHNAILLTDNESEVDSAQILRFLELTDQFHTIKAKDAIPSVYEILCL